MAYVLRGVPKVFQSESQVLKWLTYPGNAGYVSRQEAYLKKYWPGLSKKIGLTDEAKPPVRGPVTVKRKGKGLFDVLDSVLPDAPSPAKIAKAYVGAGKVAGKVGVAVAKDMGPAALRLAGNASPGTVGVRPVKPGLPGYTGKQRESDLETILGKSLTNLAVHGDTPKNTKEVFGLVGGVMAVVPGPGGFAGKAGKAIKAGMSDDAVRAASKAWAEGEKVAKKATGKIPPATWEDIAGPREEFVKGLKAAPSQYGKQKVVRRADNKARAAQVDRALRTISDPDEAQRVAKEVMRGERPRLDWNGHAHMTDEALRDMKSYVNHHDTLLPFQKLKVNDALDKVLDKKIPTPGEVELLNLAFGKPTTTNIVREGAGTWGDKVISAINIPRALQATGDFSGLLRQALVAGVTHPIIWAGAVPNMLKAAKYPAHYDKLLADIISDPEYPLALAGRVSFTDVNSTRLLKREEGFATNYAGQIPLVGRVVNGSERAYSALLNQIRMDMFKQQVRWSAKAGSDVHNEDFLKAVGDVVNAATGRGTIHGRAEHMLPALNTVLYSPRLMLSRLNYLDPSWYYRIGKGLPPQQARQMRIEALKGLFATVGYVYATVEMVSRIPGVEKGSSDPRNPNFYKLKIGNTKIDVAGGFQQYIRLASTLATNTKVNSTGGKTKLGSAYGVPNPLNVVENFLYGKSSPPVSTTVDMLRGEDIIGEPVRDKPSDLVETALSLVTPLASQDAEEIYHDKQGGMDGITAAFLGYGGAALGLGIQTYPDERPTKAKAKSKASDDFWGQPSGGSDGNDSFWGGTSGGESDDSFWGG